MEPITLARKPLNGTVAHNILTNATGGINIDGCRVSTPDVITQSGEKQDLPRGACAEGHDRPNATMFRTGKPKERQGPANHQGRWPANIIHDGSQQVLDLFPDTQSGKGNTRRIPHQTTSMAGTLGQLDREEISYGDQGSAARFFYCPKASRSERDEGLDHIAHTPAGEITDRQENSAGLNSPRAGAGRTSGGKNTHPTVKPLQLMRYLARLITPPQGTILDPWMGSGSTGIAALQEGFNFIGIELDPRHFQTALQRITNQTTTP
jgi:site-specific DNA-methyltransferase (adenine-specific)